MNTELADIFEKGIKKGLNGDLGNYKNWLINHNINPKKVAIFSNSLDNKDTIELIKSNILTPQQKNILNKIAISLGIYLQNKEDFIAISIIGEYGVGKTFSLFSTEYGLDSVNYNLKYLYIDAYRLVKEEDYYNERYSYLTNDIDVILIDSCEDNQDIINILTKFSRAIQKGVIIMTWTPVKYRDKRAEIKEIFNNLNEIEFEPFELQDTKKFVNEIVNYLLIDSEIVSDNNLHLIEFLELFYKYTKGIPNLTIKLLTNSLYEAFLGDSKKYTSKIIVSAVNNLELNQIPNFEELNKIQIDILRYIESIYDKRGARPMNLKEILELKKASLFYHLNSLKEKKILKSKRIGKSTFYYIRENLKPFIQRFLNHRREYYE